MRIAYWATSCLEPKIEAISKEIFSISSSFPKSCIFSISPHFIIKGSIENRYVGCHPSFDPILRLMIPLIEKGFDISHVYGEVSPWLYHKTLQNKNLILTIASEKGTILEEFLERCRAIIVQTKGMHTHLINLGIAPDKVHLLYPGVDLTKFKPSTKNASLKKHTILFATAPRSKEELKSRGVHLLIETAKKNPDIEFHFLFRKWKSGYSSLATTQKIIKNNDISNITITNNIIDDMSLVYPKHDFTVIPYTSPDGGKECPNSLIESLACGIPVLISELSPFSYFVIKHKCGEVFSPTQQGLRKAFEKGLTNYDERKKQARVVAEKFFCQNKLLAFYGQLYEKLTDTN